MVGGWSLLIWEGHGFWGRGYTGFVLVLSMLRWCKDFEAFLELSLFASLLGVGLVVSLRCADMSWTLDG